MTTNRFFTLETEAKRQFVQVPKQFLIKVSKYFKMSSDSKLLYGVLLDRNSLSIKNGWVDEEQNIYFIATIENLMDIMGWGNQKVTKHLKELRKYDLLHSKQRGQGNPSHHYLKQVEVEEGLETQLYQQECENHISRNVKITSQEMLKSHANNTNINNTEYNNKSSSSKEETDEDDLVSKDLDFLLNICRSKNIRIKMQDLKTLLTFFNRDEIGKILIVMNSKIDNAFSYLHKSLLNNAKKNINQITQVVEKNQTGSTGNFGAAKENERKTIEDDVKEALLDNSWGWED